MKLRRDLILRHIGGEYIIVDPGLDMVDMSKVITLNQTAAWLWSQLKDIEFDENTIKYLLQQRYDVDSAGAKRDAIKMIETLIKQGFLEDQ
jgi:hypothetical protein